MTMGRIITIVVGSLLFGVLAWFLTKSIFVAIGAPIIIIAFYFMYKSLKSGQPQNKEEEKEPIQVNQNNTNETEESHYNSYEDNENRTRSTD